MFEKEIKFITDFSLNKIKKLGAFFTFDQLQSLELHPAILKYINSELEYLISIDRKKLLQKSAFDYSDKKIQQYFDAINEEIKKNKSISFEDAKSLVMQAVSFTANYIVRPKWSLTKFIFNEDELKSVDEIKLSLNYLYYYEYIRNVLLTFIEKKKAVNLSLIDFEVALNKINRELFNTHTQQLVDNALICMADFFNIGGATHKISPLYVELFLKEKDLIDHLFRLRRSMPVDTRKQFELDDIKQIIYTPTKIGEHEIPLIEEKIKEEDENIQTGPVTTGAENEQFEEDDEAEEESKIEIIEEKPDEIEPQEKPIEIPVGLEEDAESESAKEEISDEEYFKLQDEEAGEITLDPEDETIGDESSEISDEDILGELSSDEELLEAFDSQLKALEEESKLIISDEDTLLDKIEIKEEEPEQEEHSEPGPEELPDLFSEGNELIDHEEEEELPGGIPADEDIMEEKVERQELKQEIPARQKDIFSYISDKEINKIVAGVFNDDREDFANTMEKISECLNYDEATEILKSVFFSYRVSPYTRDAVTLTNSVSNYFNQA